MYKNYVHTSLHQYTHFKLLLNRVKQAFIMDVKYLQYIYFDLQIILYGILVLSFLKR